MTDSTDSGSDPDAKPDALSREDLFEAGAAAETDPETDTDIERPKAAPYMQNRELSWLTFNERVLDLGTDETVPLLERLNFVSIFWSNLKEFFMVRVGSITDLSLIKEEIVDTKSQMTPNEQLDAIYARCHELYPIEEQIYEQVRGLLAEQGIHHLRPDDLSDEQRDFILQYTRTNVVPLLSPQIININHPFPHLENGALYVVVRLNDIEEASTKKQKSSTKSDTEATEVDQAAATTSDPQQNAASTVSVKKNANSKNVGAKSVTLGFIPLPHQCQRVIKLPGKGFSFILLEHAIEMIAPEVFSMYSIKHTNIICVTRNADLDATASLDEEDENYRDHMKRILKKRARLAPVRLESERPLSATVRKILLKRLGLKSHQLFTTSVPLDMDWTWGLGSRLSEKKRTRLGLIPFTPQWPPTLERGRSIIQQVSERDVLLSYPYESMDPFVQLIREAAQDPAVISIKITLYRLASQSLLAEELALAAENGKEVTALLELRARFDESNNIAWSQRFEEAGCNVIYGFREFKVHSKVCCITRQTDEGIQYITQLGTGNYNKKTAKLYTDLSLMTANEAIGRDAAEFFRNMALENTSDNYDVLWIAPLQIKPMIIENINREIEKSKAGKPCGLFFKTNSVTDKDIIEAIVKASQAGVPVTLFVRGISCIIPGIEGYTDNVRVVSIVGRLLEHSRIYGFGAHDEMQLYLSSADLMTRNMDKRVEIAWPILDDELRTEIIGYLDICMADTAKLRELLPDKTYTPIGAFAKHKANGTVELFASQECLIQLAQKGQLATTEIAVAQGRQGKLKEGTIKISPTDAESTREKVTDGGDDDVETPKETTPAPPVLEADAIEPPLTEEELAAQRAADAQVASSSAPQPSDPADADQPMQATPVVKPTQSEDNQASQPNQEQPGSAMVKVETQKPNIFTRMFRRLFGRKQ